MSRISNVQLLAIMSVTIALTPIHAEEIAYVNSIGEIVVIDTDDPNHPLRIDPAAPTKRFQKQNINFNVTFDDVAMSRGIGFDDPAQGAAFRNRLSDVFTYLDSILDHSGTIDILFEASENDPNGNTLASAGPGFRMTPGVTNGTAFDRLTTGVDNDPGSPEIFGMVNFGVPWFTGTGTPPNEQFDFFSTLLHELAHGLGILGLLEPNGQSGVPDVFSTWDTLTQTANGQAIVSSGAQPAFVGTVGDLTSDNLFFGGAMATASLGTRPAIFAPSPYQNGSSLSHFDTDKINVAGGFIMGPSGGPGVEPRAFAAFELGALADIGYRMESNMNPQTPTISVSPAAISNFPAIGGTRQLTITNTGGGTLQWTATTDVEWITFSSASGAGNAVITVTIDENTFEFSDTGNIVITDPNALNSPLTIVVTQLGSDLAAGCSAGSAGAPVSSAASFLLMCMALLIGLRWHQRRRQTASRE